MTGEVIVRALAEADVRNAAFWYETKRDGLGIEFSLEIDALYERIAQNPWQFPEVGKDVHRALLRRFPYAVYFIVGDQTPVIIAVLHQHRRPDAWQGRR